jgi:hypothetical protein
MQEGSPNIHELNKNTPKLVGNDGRTFSGLAKYWQECRQGEEHFHTYRRTTVHGKCKTRVRRAGVSDFGRGMWFHPDLGSVGLLGSRHTLASFLSVMDVPRRDRIEFARQPVGILDRSFRSGLVGLRQHFRYEFLLQRPWAAIAVDSHRAAGTADLLIAVPAWFFNFLVIAGCVWAYSTRSAKRLSDIAEFLICFALTTGFFAADMAVFQPRYLQIFVRLLHPHLH